MQKYFVFNLEHSNVGKIVGSIQVTRAVSKNPDLLLSAAKKSFPKCVGIAVRDRRRMPKRIPVSFNRSENYDYWRNRN